MTETQSYTIDIIKLVPDNAILFIQAPSNETPDFLQLLEQSPYQYYKQVILSPQNKKALIDLISTQEVQMDFQSIEIRLNNMLLFEGYDGMEYGTISKTVDLTEDFRKNYLKTEMFHVSSEW